MDAVISIGGQSLIDGLLRILGPALEPLRAPLPIALPGVTNGFLTIRTIRAARPSSQPSTMELELALDLRGDVLFVANVANNVLSFSGALTLGATQNAGTIRDPQRTAALQGLTGSPTATLQMPATNMPLDLNQMQGTIQVPPAGTTLPSIPFPAVVPVPVVFTPRPLTARVFFTPIVNGQSLFGNVADITAATAFGVEFDFGTPTVNAIVLGATFIADLQASLSSALSVIGNQLALSVPGLVQATPNVSGVSSALAGAIPAAAQSLLATAFDQLRARTGRLIYPVPGAGASCEVRALPTVAKARLTAAADSSLLLQIGVDRTAIPPTDSFPLFIPTAAIDTGVTIDNGYLRDLLVCLIEKVPHISLPPGPPAITNTATVRGATWGTAAAPVTVALGPISMRGTLALAITGVPAGPGAVPSAKTITLTFTLSQAIGAPLVIGSALDVGLLVTIPIAFDLSKLATLTALRDLGIPAPAVTFGIGGGLTAMLIIFAIVIAAAPLVGPFPVIWPGLAALAFLIGSLPHIVVGIVRGLLLNAVNHLLGGLRLLESPAALPSGIFEAFGPLVPTTMVVDDLVAGGVLQTPTAPWALRPIVTRGLPTVRQPGGLPGGGLGTTLPPPGTTPGFGTTSGG